MPVLLWLPSLYVERCRQHRALQLKPCRYPGGASPYMQLIQPLSRAAGLYEIGREQRKPMALMAS